MTFQRQVGTEGQRKKKKQKVPSSSSENDQSKSSNSDHECTSWWWQKHKHSRQRHLTPVKEVLDACDGESVVEEMLLWRDSDTGSDGQASSGLDIVPEPEVQYVSSIEVELTLMFEKEMTEVDDLEISIAEQQKTKKQNVDDLHTIFQTASLTSSSNLMKVIGDERTVVYGL